MDSEDVETTGAQLARLKLENETQKKELKQVTRQIPRLFFCAPLCAHTNSCTYTPTTHTNKQANDLLEAKNDALEAKNDALKATKGELKAKDVALKAKDVALKALEQLHQQQLPTPLPGFTNAIFDCAAAIQASDVGNFLPGDTGMRRAKLKDGHEWLVVDDPRLFIRTHYQTVWDRVEVERNNHLAALQKGTLQDWRILVDGNPGIGKTTSMNYLLMMAVADNIPVLFETTTKRYFFAAEAENGERPDAVWEDMDNAALKHHRDDPTVLLLHDHKKGTAPPSLGKKGCFTVAAVSPDLSNQGDFVKEGCVHLWMPLTTKAELDVMRPVLMSNVAEANQKGEFDLRVTKFGPITRTVFALDQEEMEKLVRIAVNNFSPDDATSTVFSVGIPKDRNTVSWKVVHVHATDELTQVESAFASDAIKSAVELNWFANNLVMSESLLAKHLADRKSVDPSVDLGKSFEKWAISAMSAGREVVIKTCPWVAQKTIDGTVLKNPVEKFVDDKKDPQPFKLPKPMDVVKPFDYPPRTEMAPDTMYYATKVNAEAFDACSHHLTVNTEGEVTSDDWVLEQPTIAETHTMKLDTKVAVSALEHNNQNPPPSCFIYIKFMFLVHEFGMKFKHASEEQLRINRRYLGEKFGGRDFITVEIAELKPRALLPST